MEFTEFPKMARLSREVIVTEKIDGTNAQVCIGEDGSMLAGSRTRWITPQDDNHGFAAWVEAHREELLTLGPGRHFGEWWGSGIQRGYGLKEKRFSLFNARRWCQHGAEPLEFYSANPTFSFAEALKLALGRDVLNLAVEGQGPARPMLDYLASDDFRTAPPKVVIWEFPVRYLTDPALWGGPTKEKSGA